jgi:hypothetical protein
MTGRRPRQSVKERKPAISSRADAGTADEDGSKDEVAQWRLELSGLFLTSAIIAGGYLLFLFWRWHFGIMQAAARSRKQIGK